MHSPFDPDRFAEAFAALRPAGAPPLRTYFFRETASTNDLARAHLAGGPAVPALFHADSQTRGRGRHGRSWSSPPGANLLFTLALPGASAEGLAPSLANLSAASILCRTIRALEPSLPLAVKWPNDVESGGRKIAGVLAERAVPAASASPDAAVRPSPGLALGAGLNVNAAMEELPPELRERASSLRIASGRPWPREPLLAALAAAILNWLEEPEPQRSAGVLALAWNDLAEAGRSLEVARNGEAWRGVAEGLAPDGALILRNDSGERIEVRDGDALRRGESP